MKKSKAGATVSKSAIVKTYLWKECFQVQSIPLYHTVNRQRSFLSTCHHSHHVILIFVLFQHWLTDGKTTFNIRTYRYATQTNTLKNQFVSHISQNKKEVEDEGMEGRWARNWCYAQTVGAQLRSRQRPRRAELLVSGENTMGSPSLSRVQLIQLWIRIQG